MTETPHTEKHFTAAEALRDIVLGMADGLTVPFALAAGLSGAISSTRLIVIAGLAEIAAGSIAMGLGGYLAGKGDVEHYAKERVREQSEVKETPAVEALEVTEVLRSYGLTEQESTPIVEALKKRPEAWVDFMMRFELGLERPDPARHVRSALTIGGSYAAGGCIPLMPYVLLSRAGTALLFSIVVTLTALFIFGYIKGRFTGIVPLRSAFQTTLIGGAAAAAAFLIARAIA